MRRLLARLLVLSVAASSAVAAGEAYSASAGAMCAPDAGYSVSNAVHNYKDLVPYASAPGGHTLSITITAGASVSATFSGSVEGGASAIIASAKAQWGLSFALTLTASVAYSDSWTVPSTWSSGQLHAGADRKSFKWTYGSFNGACQWIVSRSGTSNAPYHLPAFWSVRG
jgi:hypothetical protein